MGKMKQMMGKMTGKVEDSLPDVSRDDDDAFLRQTNHPEQVSSAGTGTDERGDGGVKPVS